jgi:hypothetical protein
MNPLEIAALDALDLLVVVDNESDTLSREAQISIGSSSSWAPALAVVA